MRFERVRAEIGNPACDTVIETRADIDHQVTAMHREIGLIKTMHPQHAEPFLTRGRISAKPHQRRGDREARLINQFAQQAAGGWA